MEMAKSHTAMLSSRIMWALFLISRHLIVVIMNSRFPMVAIVPVKSFISF